MILKRNKKSKSLSYTLIGKESSINLDKIYNEAYELINHKNHVFDSLLKTKFGYNNPEISNGFIKQINDMIINTIPNVAIDLTDNKNEIKNLISDFREINCFIYENLKENKIFYHGDKQYFLTETLNKIIEPCFVNMKWDNLTIKYLSLLSKRCFNDCILISDINSNDETIQSIKNNFKKIHSIYPIQNKNSIIIISQK